MNVPIIDMIMRAGWMARTVVLLLTTISLISWSIIFNRFYVLAKLSSANKNFRKRYGGLSKISDIESLDSVALSSPMAHLGTAAIGCHQDCRGFPFAHWCQRLVIFSSEPIRHGCRAY